MASGFPAEAAGGPAKRWTIVHDSRHSGWFGDVEAVGADDAWAVGSFPDPDLFLNQPTIEHWDGEGWQPAPIPPFPDDDAALNAVEAFSPTDVWAVGQEGTGVGESRTLVMHWDGDAWVILPSPARGRKSAFDALARSGSRDLWAVGEYWTDLPNSRTLVGHWDGESWEVLPSPNPIRGQFTRNALYDVAVISPRNVWAVGEVRDVPAEWGRALIEHWDGRRWRVVPAPTRGVWSELFGIAAVSASDIWAVGDYLTAGEELRTMIQHWDGSSWTIVPSPNPGRYLNALWDLEIVSRNQIWAVGGYKKQSNTDNLLTLAMRWNGRAWRTVPTPNAPTTSGGNGLEAIDVIPGTAGDLWAAGGYDHQESPPLRGLIERFGISLCEDGVDNDRDGAADSSDPGCVGGTDGSEIGQVECDDGVDNDDDGDVDYKVDGTGDPQCTSPSDDDELLPLAPLGLAPGDPQGQPRSVRVPFGDRMMS